ncbi:hypothetical protein PG991_011830 [Apiospora marii]|uniref:Uncharacterized protein n=1 Tax=Apiospora marii TaxID=335849 RepID=A0ABR1RF97_9PEZI
MSGYQGYRYQGPSSMEDAEWEDDHTRYRGNNSTSAYQAPHDRGNNDLSRRRYKPFVDEPQDEEVNDIRDFDPQTPAAIEEESSGETGYDQFSSEEDDSDDSDALSPPVKSVKSDDLERHRRHRAGPNGIGNIAHETYRWASQAAEAVTDSLGRAFQESSPGLLFLCLLISVAVLALCYALGFLTSGQDKRPPRPKLFRNPFNLTEDFTLFEERPWSLYGKLLRDEGMATWFDDAHRVDDVVAALWAGLPPLEGFAGPSAAVEGGSSNEPQPVTVTVTFPWGSKRSPGLGKDETAVQRRLRMRSAIDMRSTMRKRAEAYFENFLASRAAVVGRALDEARRFGELVETHLIAPVTIDDGKDGDGNETVVGPEFHADVAAKFGSESEKKRKVDEFAGVVVRNRTNYILSYAGLHLTSRLLEVHQPLFAAARPEPEDLPADLKGQASLLVTAKPDEFSVLADLRRAERAEKDFLADLIAQSTYSPVLATGQLLPLKRRIGDYGIFPTMALEQLVEKALALQRQLDRARSHLDWTNQWLGAAVAAETGVEFKFKVRDFRPLAPGDWVWVEAAGDLVESWGRVVEELVEALRANEEEARGLVQKKKKGDEDMKAAVVKWRVDHCARASCYGDIVPPKPAVISDEKKKKEEEEGKSLMGWFWGKKAIEGEKEQKADEVKEEAGEAPTDEPKPLSDSNDGTKVMAVCGDVATLEGKAACDRVCCGYSMHNEWADILMYGDRQFMYQDLYSGQPEAALV